MATVESHATMYSKDTSNLLHTYIQYTYTFDLQFAIQIHHIYNIHISTWHFSILSSNALRLRQTVLIHLGCKFNILHPVLMDDLHKGLHVALQRAPLQEKQQRSRFPFLCSSKMICVWAGIISLVELNLSGLSKGTTVLTCVTMKEHYT